MVFVLQATPGFTPWLTLEQEVQLLAVAAGLVFVLLIDRFVIHRLLRRLFRWIGRVPLLDIFIEKDVSFSRWAEGLLTIFFVTAAVLASLAIVGVDISSVTSWARGAGANILDWLKNYGIRVAMVLVLAYLVNRTLQAMLVPVIRGSVTHGKAGTALDEATKRAAALTMVARHTTRIVIVLVAFLMVLGVFEYNIGPLIAGLGVVGIAVGFGAQHTVRDIIAGAFIIGEDQYRVGDVASVGGKTGLVEAVNLRRTVLRDLDGVVHYIPNGEILSASNYTKDFSRVNLNIRVGYHEDLDRVIRVLNRVGADVARDSYFGQLIVETPRATRVDAFGDGGIEIKVLGVTKPIRQWEVAGELRRRIKREFDREGIQIPFQHRTIVWGRDAHPAVPPERPEAMPVRRPRRAAEDGDASLAIEPWAAEQEAKEVAEEEHVNVALSNNYERIRETVLRHPPYALFVDIDGTLARINPNPNAVAITSALRQALNTISRTMHVVALTGRDVAAARNIIGLNSITYVGNHGLEWWEKGSAYVVPEAQPYVRTMNEIARIAKRRLQNVDGLLIEDKGPTLSFHYRAAIDQEASRRAIENFLALLPEARGFEVREGKMLFELLPPVHMDKGTAVRRVVEQRDIASALALGDDVTDIDTFVAIADLRKARGLNAVCIAVQGENMPPELAELADLQARDVEDVELFLEWLAAGLSAQRA